MFTKLIWQLRQFFIPSPEKDSWAYKIHMWIYDLKVGPPVEEEKPQDWQKITIGLSFPGEFNEIVFLETFALAMHKIERLSAETKKFGVTVKEVNIKLKEYNDANNDENLPEPHEVFGTHYCPDGVDPLEFYGSPKVEFPEWYNPYFPNPGPDSDGS